MSYNDIALTDNKTIHNFELLVEGHRSFIDYSINNDKIILVHTEVPPQLRGRGIADVMVKKALEYIESKNLKLVPACSFVRAYINRHPEWNKLIP